MLTHALGYQSKLFPRSIRNTDLYAELKLTEIFNRPSTTGIWYDPQDLTTMFQDAAGTLPVYRPGSGAVDPPVGLALDKSRGLELGPELWDGVLGVVDTGGTGSVGVYDAVTGELSCTTAGTISYSPGFVMSNGILEMNKFYQVRLKFSGNRDKLYSVTLNKNSTVWGFQNGGVGGAAIRSTGGEIEYIGVCTQGVPGLRISTNGTTTWSGLFIEEISIREIKGYHAYQPTTTARPTLSGRYNILTATETLSTQSVTTVATNYTLRFEGTGTITLSGTATGVKSAGTHTITCTAGSLTLTVAGLVTRADLRVKRDGSALPAYQAVVNANTYDTAGFPLFLKRDRVDDDLICQVPTGGITGSWAHGTVDGPVFGTVAIPAGEYRPFGPAVYGLADCTQWIAVNKALNASEQSVLSRFIYGRARQQINTPQFISVLAVDRWFRGRADITGIDFSVFSNAPIKTYTTWLNGSGLTSLDTSALPLSMVTSLNNFASGLSKLETINLSGFSGITKTIYMYNFMYDPVGNFKLTTLDLSPLSGLKGTDHNAFILGKKTITSVDISTMDFSASTRCHSFAQDCTSLTTVLVGNAFDNTPCTNFTDAFTNTNLNQESIDAILVSINTAGTSNGVFNQSGGSAPSATGQAAITAMRSRGWTVTVTGGF